MSSTDATESKLEETKPVESTTTEEKPVTSSAVFSMFGGGEKKEKKEEERGDNSGSAKAQRDAAKEDVCSSVHHCSQ